MGSDIDLGSMFSGILPKKTKKKKSFLYGKQERYSNRKKPIS